MGRANEQRKERRARDAAPTSVQDVSAPLTPAWLRALPLVLFFAWVVAISFRPVNNNDFWLHLKIGQEVLATGRIPDVDTWSATAAGRPYFAHGWLSAVLYAWLHAFGPLAFALWSAAIALGIAALMVLALPARSLSGAFTLPLVALGMYVIAARFSMRPHLASLLCFAALVFALERWRADRRWRWLAWLPPVFVLWTNLHGGFLFGVGVLWIVTLGAAAQAWLGDRLGGERFAWRDVRQLGVVTLACTLATLVNPFGLRTLLFPITMSEGSDFLKEHISEWGSPFRAEFRASDPYVFALFVLFLVAAWVPTLATFRRRLPLDLLMLATVSVMAARANRFLPEVAIAGLPIAVRAWSELAAARGWPRVRRRPLVEAIGVGALLFIAVQFGYAHGPDRLRPTGSGYAGGLPYDEVARMRELGLRGVVFNELADGALLIYELGPALKPVMDARLDVYGEELYGEYRASRETPQAFLAYLERHAVDYVFLYSQRVAMGVLLEQRPEWERVFQTPTRFLFARRRP